MGVGGRAGEGLDELEDVLVSILKSWGAVRRLITGGVGAPCSVETDPVGGFIGPAGELE